MIERINMVGVTRLELVTSSLSVKCSNQLSYTPNKKNDNLARIEGIEPSLEVLETPVLPLNYIRKIGQLIKLSNF